MLGVSRGLQIRNDVKRDSSVFEEALDLSLLLKFGKEKIHV